MALGRCCRASAALTVSVPKRSSKWPRKPCTRARPQIATWALPLQYECYRAPTKCDRKLTKKWQTRAVATPRNAPRRWPNAARHRPLLVSSLLRDSQLDTTRPGHYLSSQGAQHGPRCARLLRRCPTPRSSPRPRCSSSSSDATATSSSPTCPPPPRRPAATLPPPAWRSSPRTSRSRRRASSSTATSSAASAGATTTASTTTCLRRAGGRHTALP